jgi:hypothetical protein
MGTLALERYGYLKLKYTDDLRTGWILEFFLEELGHLLLL